VLEQTTRGLLMLALLGGVVPGLVGKVVAVVVVTVVVAVPLLRVAWLTGRWAQEKDHRFAAVGAGLLSVVALGAVLAALGIGS
jgi:hypothetical protein